MYEVIFLAVCTCVFTGSKHNVRMLYVHMYVLTYVRTYMCVYLHVFVQYICVYRQ